MICRPILPRWLDALDETGRWALLKLVTGNLRVGVSARLAKTAVGALGGHDADDVEEVWHGLKPPFETLFAWVEGRAARPETTEPGAVPAADAAHPIEEERFRQARCRGVLGAEWKWDGIRMQAGRPGATRGRAGPAALFAHRRGHHRCLSRISPRRWRPSRATALDGELLILRERRVAEPSTSCSSGSTASP